MVDYETAFAGARKREPEMSFAAKSSSPGINPKLNEKLDEILAELEGLRSKLTDMEKLLRELKARR
jgi:hypothetical protein